MKLNLLKIDDLSNKKLKDQLKQNKQDLKNYGFINNNNLNPIDQPLLIKIEGKSNELIHDKFLKKNDSFSDFNLENYDSNKNLMVKEKLKENNFLKSNKNAEDKNKLILNNEINAKNKFDETSVNEFIY